MGSFVARSAYYTSSDLNMSPISNGGLAYSQVLLENAIQTPQTSVKHHMPVTVGLTVAWHFHKDWALETGLNYTLYLQIFIPVPNRMWKRLRNCIMWVYR